MNLKELKETVWNDKSTIMTAMKYGVESHINVNQFYDEDKPYTVHLSMVYNYAVKYLEIILKPDVELDVILSVLGSAWTHDTIEDCRQTFNNVLKNTNKTIADITYAVTDEKGKTRNQRKNAKFYRELKLVPYADYIKICDRLANMKYSNDKKSGMSKTYKKEYEHFKKMLYKDEYKPMFDELDSYIS
jgi:(p)ppGpp synthase/HD superfamily hydrolase